MKRLSRRPDPRTVHAAGLFHLHAGVQLTVTGNDAPLVDATDDALCRPVIVVPFMEQAEAGGLRPPCEAESEWPGTSAGPSTGRFSGSASG